MKNSNAYRKSGGGTLRGMMMDMMCMCSRFRRM